MSELLPLSFAQQRLWFLDQLFPDAALYNVPLALKLIGPLNLNAFESALNALIDRHESLRTIFPVTQGEAQQLILPLISLKIENCLEDLSALAQNEQQACVETLASQEANTPFNLSTGPLIRLKLIILSPQSHVFLITLHHIICDGWSMGVFFKELSEFYNAALHGQKPNLPMLPIQYADFALWQRQWLQGDVLEVQLSYWKQQLSDIPDLIELPTDRSRPKELSYQGAAYQYVLSKEIKDKLNALSQQQGTSLFMTLLALFQVLLYRYTGQQKIVVGSPIANRHYQEIEGLIGFFVNTLALKTSFDDNESFLDVLHKVKETTFQAYQHQDVPFDQLVDYLNVTRALNRNPVFQIEFSLDSSFSDTPLSLSAITTENVLLPFTLAKFDLRVGAFEHEEGISINFNYATDLFEEETIKRIGYHFEELIKSTLNSPSHSIQSLPLMTPQEKYQFLIEWNDTRAEYPHDKTISQLFEEQVDKNPDNIAVVFEDQELTYQQLNQKANQLAHYLRGLGVRPDTLVAIAVDRSLEMIIGLLGILKAGGAYVPLDPDYPQERLQFMLENTQAPIIITDAKTLDKLPTTWARILCLEEEWNHISTLSSSNLLSLTLPHHLAYVIYTSGSTGKPKGVMVDQNNLASYLNYSLKTYPIPQTGRSLLHSSIAFDMSITSLFLPLITGQLIHILSSDSQTNSLEGIARELERVDFIKLTPTHLRALKETLASQELIHKERCFVIGGENLLKEDITSWFENKNSSLTSLFNEYGPTESTVGCCVFKIDGTESLNQSSILIGRPINNTQIYILDSYLNPVPVGVSGEIYIGGAGLARGYLNRPDLTAEKFIPNPFLNEDESNYKREDKVGKEKGKGSSISLRLYRTGDLARYLPDGNIEFIGRIDDQVKIRGFRIELGEIETVLAHHGDVNQAVVIAREDEPGHKQLVAYVMPQESILSTLETEAVLTASDHQEFVVLKGENLPALTDNFRNYLALSLPDYMIPAFFVFINKVPLTPNGKIDRKALPAPHLSLRQVGEEYVAPTTSLEQKLCTIWAEVLRIETIGIHDNFFKLGGHSLLATQVISRIRHTYNIDLPLRALFENPTVSALSQDVELLTGEKILSSIPPIVAGQRPTVLPLSFAQQRLWFLDQLLPDTALYNIPLALKLIGSLNLNAFESALNALIDRHESLRTIFPATQGEAQQLILPLISLKIENCLEDLSALAQNEQQAYVETLASQEANTPFNLSTGPLIRLKIIKLFPQEHVLLITLHHIISDGWSMGIFFKELSELYNAVLHEQKPNLPVLLIQYADFALWQRQWLQGDVLETQLSYWKQQLSDVPDLLEFPTDRPRPKELSYQGATYHYTLSKEIKDQLNQLSQQQGTSLFMTLLALFQILLYRYTGQKDIVVGSPIANRHYQEIEGLIGFFVNTLALKTSFDNNESFLDILHKVKETTLQAYQHQDVPFEQLVDYLNIERRLNRNPVFQVVFSLQNTTTEEEGLILHDIQTTPAFSSYSIAKFDLSVFAFEYKDGINIGFDYSIDLFEEKTIRRFGSHFEELIKSVLQNPTQSFYDLPLLTAQEQHQLLIEWNDTKVEYPDHKTIPQLFEEQVDKTPDNIAVVFEDQELTYQQLNQKANQLAHYLRGLGVRPDTLVAIAVDRSLEMIIGLLGILKAGGAYVPLDPDYPQERLQFMLEDTNAPILITQTHLQYLFKNYFHHCLCLKLEKTSKELRVINKKQHERQNDNFSPVTLQHWITLSTTQPNHNPISITLPHHLAYVIYTSGSTGKPKGVLIDYHGLSNRLVWMQQHYQLNYLDRILQKTPFTFDVSVWELFLPLIIGATEIIAKPQGHKDAEYIYNIIQNKNISVTHFVPSMLESYLQAKNLGAIENRNKSLRLTITSGEALSLDSAKDHYAKIGSELHNLYGPTEASIDSTSYFYDPKKNRNIIPIGRPISNTQIYILDCYLNPVPVGVSGEIYIGGAGLARGYLNRPDLTAEKFVPNPFINTENLVSSLRLYRTGDLARYLPDGNIEFLGRIDDQVKIRGFRIELGEIETVFAHHGDVNQAVVIAREDGPGHKQLVAYVMPQESILSALETETVLTASDHQEFVVLKGENLPALTESLKNHLIRSLPDYMIPAFFIFINKVPLTPNGKIDRKALPAPHLSLRQVGEEYVAPTTSLEQELCTIWAEVLRIEKIGIHDNFFKLGGHSLLATQVISRIRHTYNIDLPLRALFENPTVSALSQDVELLTGEKILSSIPPIVAGQRPTVLPLSFAQQRLWFLDQLLPDTALYNIPLALKLIGSLNLNAFESALNALIDRHESLRTIFPATQGEAQQLILPLISLKIENCLEDLSALAQNEQQAYVETLASQEANTPFNLSTGPLIRLKIIKLFPQEHVLLITLHHIISDGWSMGIFFKELSELYNAVLHEQKPNLPVLLIQYADFALWQRQWLQGDVLETQLSYWKQQLSDVPDLLEFPTDRPRPKELSYQGATYHYTLSKEIKDQLNQLSQQQGTSLFMTLLALFQILLYRYTGQKDIVVGSPIANRHYQEIEGLIGFFVNTLALKTSFDNNESFLDILHKVKETTLQSYQHQDIYFDQLVDYLNIERRLNRNPVFQIEFSLESVFNESLPSLSSLLIENTSFSFTPAKFDLRVGAFEREEGISIGFDYATDLFEEGTIARFSQHLEELIKTALKDPSQSIYNFPLITNSEQHQFLIEWNDTKTEYPDHKTISQLFEEQVDKTPDNIAVVFEDQELTYQQLNQKANQLAHYLRGLGVRPDTLVAIAVDRSLEMIIGLLGILKAGGAYVPLDPDYPQERLQFMLENTQAPIIITDAKTLDKLPTTWARILCLEEEWNHISTLSSSNLLSLTLPHHLAYVIYTSGSTGKPKGVMVDQNNLASYLNYSLKTYPIPQTGRSLLHSSIAFDMSITSLFLPLITGQLIHILSSDSQTNSLEGIARELERVDFIKLTPTHLRALKETLASQELIHKERCFVIGGENLLKEDITSWFENKNSSLTSLFNEYGPTESTVGCCVFKIDGTESLNQSSILIGRPINNTQIYILDSYLNPVPVGVSGEIYIGGAGLARGYLNRPDLTAEKFIPNPFLNEDESNYKREDKVGKEKGKGSSISLRLYRTGDLARYLPDGNIEFIGRIDDQVKIRGFRIELGEIETVLAHHGDVNQAVVIAREDEPGHKQLVAYVMPQESILSTLETEAVLTASDHQEFVVLKGENLPALTDNFRNYLALSLPDYMIPAFFVFINKVPLTPNGKIDRKALPAPHLSLRQVGEEYVAPTTSLEQKLCTIWAEVLRIETIGIHDNFFKLGGHSLLATQVISRIRHTYNIDLPLRALFENPTVSALSQDVELLTGEKILSSIPPIVAGQRPTVLPLSFAQQRLWFLDQLLPDTALYNIPLALKLIGSLNLNAFESALNALIDRHESLRTIFPATQGEAQQLILPLISLKIENCLEDLSALAQNEQQAYVETLASQEANTPFNLSTGPLIRLKIIKLFPQEHVLLITLHHIISDGWSMGIFFKELSELYNAVLHEQKPNLPVLLIQYADFALWQRQWLQGDVLETQLSYWKQQLSDVPDLLEFPTDRPRPKELSYQGATYHYTLSKEIKDQLNQLSQQQGTSLFMTLLALFQILLYRYTGQKDIVVGSPIANRHYQEIEGLIGFFVNTLALKTSFDNNESFLDILHKVKETTLQAYQHQDVPFEQLVDYLNIERRLNRNPVFQVVFSLQNTTTEEEGLILHDIQTTPAFSSYSIAKFDLSVFAFEYKDGINIGFDYSIDLFEEKTIRRFGSHFEELIKSVLQNPTQSFYDLPLLTAQEQHQLLIEWNDTKVEYPDHKTIPQLFEEQVDKTPDNIAVVYENQKLTYQQLNQKANQLAHYLRGLGVGPDTLVAIAVERSLEMIIGLLGILKAGGSYVPLDPDYPQERLQFMLDDTQAPILITQMHLRDCFKKYPHNLLCLELDKDSQDLRILTEKLDKQQDESELNLITLQNWVTLSTTQPNHNPISITHPHHLAYVIYTSGSTGKPKGVKNTHYGLWGRLVWTLIYYPITEKDSFLHIASIGFDISVWEMIFPLSVGASLIIAGEKENKDMLSIAFLINTHKITTLHFVPSLLKLFTNPENSQNCQSLSQIITGGEALSTEVKQKFISSFKKTDLYLAYGPTEAAISVTHWNCREKGYLDKTPIGRPISNAQIYILDFYLNPVPVGVSGEIYIGGAGLARGYLNRPDLTAEKFIPNPFLNEDESNYKREDKVGKEKRKGSYISLRLYRTGDLARYLPDGNIEFIGRIDDQVKIRGFRIELGEIETVLAHHGDVNQAVVIAREDEPGHKQLVAYVIPQESILSALETETILTASDHQEFVVLKGEDLPTLTESFRNYLALSLPDYMIPAFFVFINKVPLTPNGKIDRKALPAPDLSLRQVGEEYIAPTTSLEQELCTIWAEVLRIDTIGIHDNFFRIGGDSIISIQLAAKARQKGIHFAVKDIFNHPTIAALTLVVQSEEETLTFKPEQNLVKGDIPLTPIQHWFFEQNLKSKHHFNQATLLQIHEQIDPSLLHQSFEVLISHHDALRCRYNQKSTKAWKQKNLDHEENSSLWNTFDLTHLSDKELPLHLEQQANLLQQSLDVETGPLIKVALFDCGKERPDRLLIVIHHLVVDGVSWRILLEDLEHTYQSLKEDKTPALSPKTHSYQQWGRALLTYAQSEKIKQQIPYWQTIECSIQALPIDCDKGPNTGSHTQTIALSLTQEETTALLQRVPKAYLTQINDVLLTALTLAIGDWTQDYSLSLSLEGHGREDIIKDIDLSRTIGWFTSIFPVYLKIENPDDLAEAIKTVKETLRQVPDKGIGYGILKYLTSEKPLSRSFTASNSSSNSTSNLTTSLAPTHPSLSFNYLGQWDNTLSQDGLFEFTQESAGHSVAEENSPSYLLNINCEVKQGVLQTLWSYSSNHYQTKTIETVAQAFLNRLKQTIHHCSQEHNFGYTPSDFNLISLSQSSIDTNFGEIAHIESIYPLSPMQSGLLFQALYASASDAYFVQSVFEIEGDVDTQALQSAWQMVSDHHPILRTGILWEKLENPLQYILESVQVPFTQYNWQDIDEVDQQNKLETFIQEDRQKGFDLSKAPLFRITLTQCTKDKYYLIWSQHHILTDGWSLPIILKDLFKTYEAIRQGKEFKLAPRRPYRDYIAWLQQQDMKKAEAFWKDYLATIEAPTHLSFKNIIQKIPEKDYDTFSMNLSAEETEHLKRFAQAKNLTLNTVLQGAVGFILKTYTQQHEVTMGITVSGRSINLSRIEEMVGLFINTLPLKIAPQPEDTILSFLTNIQNQTQKLNDYTYTSLAQIQSWSRMNQSLFYIIFVFENYPIEERVSSTNDSFRIKSVKGIEKTEYPLTIVIGTRKELCLSLSYQTEHFNQEFIAKFSDHIKQVLYNMVQGVEKFYDIKDSSSIFSNHIQSLNNLSLLTSKEENQLLIEWNNTKAEYPHDKTVHQLFEEQVEKTPENIAVVYEDQELTYQQLNEKANQLAHYLRDLGVGPDTLVAIAVERSLEMIIGLLGILKAGGAYVPLDPDYPQERLQFMLEDTQAPILITQTHLRNRFKDYPHHFLCLELEKISQDLRVIDTELNSESDQHMLTLSTQPSHNPTPITLPHHLAYVIYTSGSTGKPKGVLVENSSISNHMLWMKEKYNFSHKDKVLQRTAYSFDASIWEVFMPLLSGAQLIIPTSETSKNPILLMSVILRRNITKLQLVPALLKLFSNHEKMKDLETVEQLFIGGEALFTETVDLLPYTLKSKIINLYGPTEASIDAISYLYDPTKEDRDIIPIGRPISNTQIYILDSYQNPVPVGVSGEIYIGGAGLARGYLNRPDLTAEKFVPNPFVNEEAFQKNQRENPQSLRLYRTGDLARYLPDGNIEFLGRIDDQVKIRGFRIELGEIESTLSHQGSVNQAVVMAREDEPGQKQLVAYVVPQESLLSTLDKELVLTAASKEEFAVLKGETLPALTEDLRNSLARSLPDYMIPAFFVFIDRVPLTPNGKIDRKALPAPDLTLRQVGEQYVAPTSTLEQDLAAIWTEVLKIEKIGIHDNFFKLGGHSLLATQVISRIRHSYNIDLPLRALFEHPTLQTLSQDVEQLTGEKALSEIPPIVAQLRPNTLPLSFAQQRLWFLDQLLPDSALYNVPLALKLNGPLNLKAFEIAFNALIERHESLRTIFPVTQGEAQQLILPHLSVKITDNLTDLSVLSRDQQQKAIQTLTAEEANTPFDLATGPLIRLKLLQISSHEHVLFITLHHIISDGWSMGIFFKELSVLYTAALQNQDPNLPALPIQYADFALWQRQWLQGDVLEAQLAYWKQQLSGVPDLLELPTDKPRPKELTYQGATYHFTLSKEIKDQLNQLSQQQGTSLFMTLLALFQILLYRYTGQKDIVVGSPIANRHYQEIEGLIGFFVNTLALKTSFDNVDNNESFLDVLHKVKETTLQAYQHQDVPFEQLVDYLNITRALNRNPVFQTMFILQNATQNKEGFSFPEIQINPVFSEYLIAKFDLSVSAFEYEEGLSLAFEYATDLFEEETIKRLGVHFEELIKETLKNPSYSIHDLPLLTSTEQQQLLIEWNDTKTEYPDNKTIHQLFEEQVDKTPDNIAVVYEDQELTYRQLNQKANQLAHYLRTLEVGPDTLVAIAVDRSLEMIIGLLGILKAGGAYVPLDPDYPQERLQFMLDDTNAPILLTQSHLQDKLSAILSSYKGTAITMDQIEQILQQQNSQNPPSFSLPYHLAYVIYTSGSTGKPKGVMVRQKNLNNFLVSFKKKIPFISTDKFLALTTLAFDIAGLELYCPLLAGASLLLARKHLTSDIEKLKLLINHQNPTIMQATPTLWKMLLDNGWKGKANLNALCGGEAAQVSLMSELVHKTKQVWNLYGPTETTVWSSAKVYTLKEEIDGVSIGRPIDNTQIYILDSYQNPVPVGVSGELHIGGAGLALGYLNRPDLTAEKFIPNPFINEQNINLAQQTGSASLRLYRTGDLARYLPDGNIEFLGRIDDQVKIRGFRIELGEIESTLSQQGDVNQAVVIAREDEPGLKQLVAYILPQESILSALETETVLTASDHQEFVVLKGENLPALTENLKNHLIRFLPDYMIPAFFVFINKIPLTPNGKIDRKALPAPDLSLRHLEEQYVAPTTSLEQELCTIWAEVLRIETIGIHDNFFKLGGHSLLATQMISKINTTTNINLSLIGLFENPTIKMISKMAELDFKFSSKSTLITIEAGKPQHTPLFMIHPGGGLSYCYTVLSKYLKDTPIYGLNNPNFEDYSKNLQTVEDMARCYVKIIKDTQNLGPYSISGWSFGGIVAYEIAQQLYSIGDYVENLILIDTINPNSKELREEDTNKIEKREGELENKNIFYFLDEATEKLMEHNLKTSSKLMKKYKPTEYKQKGNSILLKAEDQSIGTSEDYGWKKNIPTLIIRKTPGSHSTLFDPSFAESTAKNINHAITGLVKSCSGE